MANVGAHLAIHRRFRAGPRDAGVRHRTAAYLTRRSAGELAVLDALVLAGAGWIVLPAFSDLDWFWLRVLIVFSPGLMLVARSLVVALAVPGALATAGFDPGTPPQDEPRLDEARALAWYGGVVLAITGAVVATTLAGAGVYAGLDALFF